MTTPPNSSGSEGSFVPPQDPGAQGGSPAWGGPPPNPGQPNQQQPGQPQQPQPGPPMGYGATDYATRAPEKKKNGLLRGVIAVVAVVAIGLVVRFAVPFLLDQFNKEDAQKAKIKDCVAVTGTTFSPELDIVDCGEASANYVVMAVDSQAECATSEFTLTREDQDEPETVLCLAYNWEDGECYRMGAVSTIDIEKVTCEGSPLGDGIKVDSINEAADESVCNITSSAQVALVFPEANRVDCTSVLIPEGYELTE